MKIKINETNGYVLTDCHANLSVSFFANIPEDAVVKSVIVDGKHLEDYIECDVKYPRTIKDDDWRVVAVFKNAENTGIYEKAQHGLIHEFEVECK